MRVRLQRARFGDKRRKWTLPPRSATAVRSCGFRAHAAAAHRNRFSLIFTLYTCARNTVVATVMRVLGRKFFVFFFFWVVDRLELRYGRALVLRKADSFWKTPKAVSEIE